MKSLVVLSGAIIVAAASIVGLWQMDKKSPQVAGFLAMVGNNEPIQKDLMISDRSDVKVKTSPAVIDIEKRLLIAALAGSKLSKPVQQNTDAGNQAKSVKKNEIVGIKKTDVKLLNTIRKKAVMVPEKVTKTANAPLKSMRSRKKTIGYNTTARSQLVANPKGFAVSPEIEKEKSQPINWHQKLALLTKKERQGLGRLVEQKKLPALNLIIEFDYKSAQLSDKALPLLDKVGIALKDGKLANSTFAIAGHTDSAGGHHYNMNLSSRRASSVRNYLQEHHNIDGKRLVAIGYGEERLKNKQDPLASENRRVEFINLIR